jgi:peptidoglycan/xylan/chitin deacetylase (PgdA/CDA1 family)
MSSRFYLFFVFSFLTILATHTGQLLADDSETNTSHYEIFRQHKLKHSQTLTNTSEKVLSSQCRYESDIATAPPKNKIVLTFDDGPDPNQTPYILEILKQHGIHATFFLVGHRVQNNPQWVSQILEQGHLIGNHSWDHPNFHDIATDAQLEEIERTQQILASSGTVRYFRYPYGNATCESNQTAHDKGYGIVGWHIDTCDWAFDTHGYVDEAEAQSCGVLAANTHNFVDHVIATAKEHHGGILLMHEIHPSSIHQLNTIIEQLKEQGFEFTNLDDPEFSKSIR